MQYLMASLCKVIQDCQLLSMFIIYSHSIDKSCIHITVIYLPLIKGLKLLQCNDVLLISSVTIIITVETGIEVHTHVPVPFML